MKKAIILLTLLLILLTTVYAAVDVEEVSTTLFDQENITEQIDSSLQPLVDTIQPFLKKVSVLVGGIFGLYLILILLRVHYERRSIKLLKDIRYDLDQLNMHYEISHSRESNGIFRRFWHNLKNGKPKVKEVKKKKSKK